MKNLILIINLLLFFRSEAQQNYFNNRFDYNSSWHESAWSIYSDTGKIFITVETIWNDGIGDLIGAALLQIDQSGNILDTNFYTFPMNYTFPGGSGSLNKINGGFILGGSRQDSLNADAALFNLDENGNLIWSQRYGDTSYQSGWMAKQTQHHGFVLCGQDGTDGTFGGTQILLIKTDSVGNLEWQKNYGDSNTAELAYAVIESSDGGFVLAGDKKYLTNHGQYDIDLIKTDSMGNLAWEKIIGGIYTDRLYSVISTIDGNIVVTGFVGRSSVKSLPYLAKFDLAGNNIWEKTYGDSTHTLLRSVRELADASLIAVGYLDVPDSTPSTGLIIKTTSNGDSLWYKRYSSSSPPFPLTDCYLNDIYPTPDGGFVACGYVNPVPPDTGNQDVWILKIDSNGCEIANCTTSIEDLFKKSSIKIYPNPVSTYLNIELGEIGKSLEVMIYNMLGRKVKQFSFDGKESRMNFSDLPEGLFLLNLIQEDQVIYTGKVNHISAK